MLLVLAGKTTNATVTAINGGMAYSRGGKRIATARRCLLYALDIANLIACKRHFQSDIRFAAQNVFVPAINEVLIKTFIPHF
jgi:hypothetical protein